MSLLPSDIMLSVFKLLNSKEMVQVMLVSKEWLEIIDENRALWRSLILPETENGWDRSALKVFDKKSDSTLKEVSMEVASMNRDQAASFVRILEKSKQTLEVLALTEFNPNRQFYELPRKLTNLVDCRFLDTQPKLGGVQIVRKKGVEKSENEDSQGSRLKVLWLHVLPDMFHSFRLENVQSFHLLRPIWPSTCREVLLGIAATLKDLQISPGHHANQAIEAVEVEPLEFPLLEIFQLSGLRILGANHYPSWIKIPLTATLFIDSMMVPSSLPSVSKLWISGVHSVDILGSCCPELETLRVTTQSYSRRDKDDLLSMLKTRKRNAKAEMEVSGVKMILLKTIVIEKSIFTSKQLSEISELVEEVVDLDSVPKFIEVEI